MPLNQEVIYIHQFLQKTANSFVYVQTSFYVLNWDKIICECYPIVFVKFSVTVLSRQLVEASTSSGIIWDKCLEVFFFLHMWPPYRFHSFCSLSNILDLPVVSYRTCGDRGEDRLRDSGSAEMPVSLLSRMKVSSPLEGVYCGRVVSLLIRSTANFAHRICVCGISSQSVSISLYDVFRSVAYVVVLLASVWC